ncbi:vacuolar protein sorting-associated protein 33B [Halyomorpha halys]|uniref:vacuolar protein sorting-associated protein 33B n=1 Tax=Halyomorpha halys TaxID=286706 RepID=UPI0006D5008B|nr:vacuolar protein sorting-associated protein 33B [Halyomorpha halys]
MQYTLDGKINALKQISQRKLLNILDKIPGRKDFIVDVNLIKPLEHIIGVAKLRSSGVDKIYKLEKTPIPCTNTQRVFFIQGDLITVKHVCDKINSELTQQNDGNSYHLIIVFRKLGCAMKLLEEEGVYGCVQVYNFLWELISLENRVLSLEFQNFYKYLFVNGDQSYLPCVAKSIWTLQMIFGKPSTTLIQGKYSHLVDKMLDVYYEELGKPSSSESDISCFVIVDRDIDYASTLLTGGTYSSLLDEVFGIKSGYVEVKQPDKNEKPSTSGHYLNNADEIYSQIKNRHFSDVFPFLSSKTKELSAEYQKSQNMNIQEMKRYVSEELSLVAKKKMMLAYHIIACEAIISDMGQRFESLQTSERNMVAGRNHRDCVNYIEECLAMNTCSKYSILRLMSLLSITQDGIPSDEYQRLRMQFLHVHGYHNLPGFFYLEKSGLCIEQPGIIPEVRGAQIANKVVQAVSLPARRSTFGSFSQKLKLFPDINESYDLKNAKDLGFVFGGTYIPVVCQLVHILYKQEISHEDLMKIVPHLSIKYNRNVKTAKYLRTFVVYFIGGVTYAEICAFQLLEKLTGAKIIVASTSISNGNLLMKSYFN